VLRREKAFQFLAQIAGGGWATTAGGDGDREVAAASHSRQGEIAIRGSINDVKESSTSASLSGDGAVSLLAIGGGDDEEGLGEIAFSIWTLEAGQPAFLTPALQSGSEVRADDGNLCLRL